jgi:hypothetical protein
MKDLHVLALRTAGLSLILANLALSAAEFYVSPTGDDSNPGTRSKPFASLERARDSVRLLKRQKPGGDYTVLIRGGLYRLKDTVRFSVQDSAAEGHTVTYAAYPKERPVFSSAVPLEGWKQEGNLWVAELHESVKPFYTLYDRAGRLPRARSKPFSPTLDYRAADKLDRFTLPFPAGTLRPWSNLGDVEIMIRPNYGWVLNLLPLESVNEQTGLARTALPASYPMVKVRWGPRDINANGTAWVENVLEALDEPGEWVLNTQDRKIYLWPRGDKPEAIEAAQLTELLRVEGEIDYNGPRDRPVRGLVFRGLSFTRGDRWPWEKERIGSTLQHDWEMFDRPTAMVRLRGAEGVAFEQCRWFEGGGAAIRLDLHAQSNRVVDSVIEKLGGAGIVLAGYGPGTKDVNRRNEILGNHIHHIGEILWHAAAISVWQSGENRVANNLIHDVNYTAITVSGRINWNKEGRGDGWRTIRWKEVESAGGDAVIPTPSNRPAWRLREPFLHGRRNIVERNEIYGVMQNLWDGDGIYISGTGGGNLIRRNFVHDCRSENMCEGIRCDDDQNETTIEQNVLYRNGGMGTGIAIKGRNYIINNFIVEPTGTFQPRGLISLEGVPVEGSIIERNILCASKPGLRPFFLKNLMGPPDPRLRETKTDFNLFWHASDSQWAAAHLAAAQAEGMEAHSRVGNPQFRNPESGDFRFQAGSPAPKMGIVAVDMRSIGPTLGGRVGSGIR